jgi:hypothetical protein
VVLAALQALVFPPGHGPDDPLRDPKDAAASGLSIQPSILACLGPA